MILDEDFDSDSESGFVYEDENDSVPEIVDNFDSENSMDSYESDVPEDFYLKQNTKAPKCASVNLQYEKFQTITGMQRIIVDGHLFQRKSSRNQTTAWICSQSRIKNIRCNCRASTYQDIDTGTANVRGSHNHERHVHNFSGLIKSEESVETSARNTNQKEN